MNDPIDREAPGRRPDRKQVGYQNWRDLLFLHREVPVEAVAATLPRGLAPDLHEGRAYVGVIPLKMRDVRPRWIPPALAFDFLETNVRTYVLCDGVPGIYFYSLEANSPVAVRAARIMTSLPYFDAQMRSDEEGGLTRFVSVRRRWKKSDRKIVDLTAKLDESPRFDVRYRTSGAVAPGPAPAGSLDRFLIERYYLFVRRRGSIWRGQVHHVPYPLQPATVESVEDTLLEAAGFPSPQPPFTIFHYSPGVDVEMFALEKVAPSP